MLSHSRELVGSGRCSLRCVRTRPLHVLETTWARKRKQKAGTSGQGGDNEAGEDASPNRRFSRKMSLKQQLLLLRERAAQEKRAAGAAASAAPARTSYRRRLVRTPPEEDNQEETETAESLEAQKPEVAASEGLPKVNATKERARQKWFIVDGYNVIGAAPELNAYVRDGDLETARRLLIEDVTNLSAIRGWHFSIVFDATTNPQDGYPRTKDTTEKITTALIHPDVNAKAASGTQHQSRARKSAKGEEASTESVEIIYPACKSADSYIISRVRGAARDHNMEVWAATGDSIVQSLVRASGAFVISSELFLREVENAKTEMRVIHRLATNEPGLALIDCLDQESRDRLLSLKESNVENTS
jgi:predicted RNA-binding protein with PIN domain